MEMQVGGRSLVSHGRSGDGGYGNGYGGYGGYRLLIRLAALLVLVDVFHDLAHVFGAGFHSVLHAVGSQLLVALLS